MELEELYNKHHVLSDGLQRVYVINRDERRLDMDRSTPIEMHMLLPRLESDEYCGMNPKSVVIKERSWVQMIKEACIILLKHHPKSRDELYGFRVDWSSAVIFDKTKSLINMQKIDEDLYVNVGHTSNHMLWLLEDLYTFFCDDDYSHPLAFFLIHRPPFSEPAEISKAVEEKMKNGFIDYLKSNGIDEAKIGKVLKVIDLFNYMLIKERGSYNDIYLIDNYATFTAVKSKIGSIIPKYTNWNEAQIKTATKYLNYYFEFFKGLDKASRENKINFYIPII